MVAFHEPHKACSSRCHQFSHSVGMATGRFKGLFPIVVNTQSAPLWIRLWKKWNLGIWIKFIPKQRKKWVADWNLAMDSLMSQYSNNKLTPFANNPAPSTEEEGPSSNLKSKQPVPRQVSVRGSVQAPRPSPSGLWRQLLPLRGATGAAGTPTFTAATR